MVLQTNVLELSKGRAKHFLYLLLLIPSPCKITLFKLFKLDQAYFKWTNAFVSITVFFCNKLLAAESMKILNNFKTYCSQIYEWVYKLCLMDLHGATASFWLYQSYYIENSRSELHFLSSECLKKSHVAGCFGKECTVVDAKREASESVCVGTVIYHLHALWVDAYFVQIFIK